MFQVFDENKKLLKELKGVKSQGIDGEIDAIATQAEKIKDYHFVFGAFSEASTDDTMRALDILKAKFKSSVILLANCESEDKVSGDRPRQ